MARRRLERDSARHRQLREWPERLWLQTRREEGRPWLASQRSLSWCREDDPEELRNALMALESATRFVGSPDPTLPAGRSERQELGEGVKAESRNECRERGMRALGVWLRRAGVGASGPWARRCSGSRPRSCHMQPLSSCDCSRCSGIGVAGRRDRGRREAVGNQLLH